MPKPLNTANYSNIVVLTGAGISVASGLATFRGKNGGLAEELLPVSDGRKMPAMLPEFWRVYGALRAVVAEAQPNAAHLALAAWQQKWSGLERSITLVTQNVDGLHSVAGSPDVVEIHGSLRRTRCTNTACKSKPFPDARVPDDIPTCPVCGQPQRLDIVLFNEDLPLEATHRVKRALRDCDLFLAIGTSGTVWPAADFVRSAAYSGARTIYLNLEPMEDPNPYFKETLLGRAEELLPQILD
jgi:NAD-dependent deacetylase